MSKMPNSNEKTFEQNYKSRYLRYLKIKENRQLRLKSIKALQTNITKTSSIQKQKMEFFFRLFEDRLCLRAQKNSKGVLLCPICIEPLSGTKDEINMHLMNCSNQVGASVAILKLERSELDNFYPTHVWTDANFFKISC
jgi:hypothetical protein